MRLIGNKTRLLEDIEGFLRERGVTRGTLIDIFSGTAAVARHFKSLGFRVLANDALSMCYAKAVADVEVSRYPSFGRLREHHSKTFRSKSFQSTFIHQTDGLSSAEDLPLAEAIHFLQRFVEPCEGIISRNFCPGGRGSRMYFSDDNGKRIDGMLAFLRESSRSGVLSRDELYVLLSALLDAADRVANISGTYGAFLKTWQRSALAPVALKVPEIVVSPHQNRAYQRDANELARELKGDVLYIDPPYNQRQYAANYHILQVLAEHHAIDDLAKYETELYGKTGLRPYAGLKSLYCVPPSTKSRGQDVLGAMTDLVLSSRVDHVLISYNEEGLLTQDELGTILSRFSGTRSFDFSTGMRSVLYRRFCSDSDRGGGGAKGRRRYKVLEGKDRGQISEWLFFASRAKKKSRPTSRIRAAARAGS